MHLPPQTKPLMYRCRDQRLWKCQLETTVGKGTTRRHAYAQLWSLLSVTHPHLKPPKKTL